MDELVSKLLEHVELLESYISSLEKENEIQDQIIQNYKKMTDDRERQVEILEELLKRAREKNTNN